MTDRDTLINERKATSVNYHEWQSALKLRDRIYKEVGSGNKAADQVRALIQHWHAKWQAEVNEIDAKPSAGTRALLDAALIRAGMETDLPSAPEQEGDVDVIVAIEANDDEGDELSITAFRDDFEGAGQHYWPGRERAIEELKAASDFNHWDDIVWSKCNDDQVASSLMILRCERNKGLPNLSFGSAHVYLAGGAA